MGYGDENMGMGYFSVLYRFKSLPTVHKYFDFIIPYLNITNITMSLVVQVHEDRIACAVLPT